MIPFFPVRFPILNDKINYRNHRKIVIIDGNEGFVGGLNIGDEYLGRINISVLARYAFIFTW